MSNIPKERHLVLSLPRQHVSDVLSRQAREVMPGLYFAASKAIYEELLPKMPLGEFRGSAETNPHTRHVIVYDVFVNHDQSKVFAYQRVKGGDEERLLGQCSIGVGGHVNFDIDIVDDYQSDDPQSIPCSPNDFTDTLMDNARYEEYSEEINVDYDDPQMSVINELILLDDSDPVGRQHLGLVNIVHCEPRLEDQICCKEDQAVNIGWVDPKEVNLDDYESWSRILLSYLKDRLWK